jgi:hypothetical protein
MPKLVKGGCYTAHNVSMGYGRRNRGGIGAFLDYVKSLPNFETTIVNKSFAGISVSYKKAKK